MHARAPADWAACSSFGTAAALLRLLNRVRTSAALPLSELRVLLCCLPKPQGGERAVALVGTFSRLLFTLARSELTGWAGEAARARHWNSATAGSSALRAAIPRAA